MRQLTRRPLSMSVPTPALSSTSSLRRWLLAAVLGWLLVTAFVVHQLDIARRQAQAEAELSSQRLALTLENFLLAHVSSVDMALANVADEFAALAADGHLDSSSFTPLLERQRQRLHSADALRATDANGQVIYGSGLQPGQHLNVADRPYFVAAQRTTSTVLGMPVQSRITGQWVLPMARAVRAPDGRFLGMVYAFTNTQRILDLFASVNAGSQGVVTLFDDQRRVLLRHPVRPQDTPDAVPTLTAAPTLAALAQGRTEATYRTRSSVDGVDRVLSYRRIGSYPLYVIVGVARDDFLASWQRQAGLGAALVATLGLALLGMGTLLRRAWQRREQALLELQQHEAALQQTVDSLGRSEARFRALTDGLPQMVWMSRPDGGALLFSHHWLSYTGCTAEQMMDEATRMTLLHPDDAPLLGQAWRHALAAGTPYRAQCRIRRHDGVWRVFDSRALPQRDASGQIVSWVGSNTDITEAQQAHETLLVAKQAADEANKAKSAFLAMMSHEMRTPLNGVMGFAHLGLRDPLASDKAQQHFGRILESSRLLLQLIDDVLDFSKIEAGKLSLELLPVPLWPLLDEVLTLLDERAAAKGLKLQLDAAPQLPEQVLADPLRLKQVLMNLLSNAVKFTESGVVQLRADWAGGQLRLVVQDTGIGMDEAQQARLFRPFEQADGSTTRRFGGTGLGLAITQRLVQLMGGEISVSSTPGQGSCFTLRLPCALPGEAAAPAVPAARATAPGAPGSR